MLRNVSGKGKLFDVYMCIRKTEIIIDFRGAAYRVISRSSINMFKSSRIKQRLPIQSLSNGRHRNLNKSRKIA